MSKNERKWTEMVFVHLESFCFVFGHFAPFVKGDKPFYLENGHLLKVQIVCGYGKISSLFTYYKFCRNFTDNLENAAKCRES